MTTKPISLKPCPFCGSDAELRTDGDEPYPYWINCNQCMTGSDHQDPQDAVDEWNNRVEEQSND